MSDLVTKPKPEDFKCRQLANNEVEWNRDHESEAIKYFVAEEYYQRMRAEFAIAHMKMLMSCHPKAVRPLYEEALVALKANE